MEKYRPQILHPLGFDAGKPVPIPKGLTDEISSSQGYTKVGENRESKELKPFEEGSNALQKQKTK